MVRALLGKARSIRTEPNLFRARLTTRASRLVEIPFGDETVALR